MVRPAVALKAASVGRRSGQRCGARLHRLWRQRSANDRLGDEARVGCGICPSGEIQFLFAGAAGLGDDRDLLTGRGGRGRHRLAA